MPFAMVIKADISKDWKNLEERLEDATV